ncbi:hypothetical protein R3X47_23760, partial [Salmonella enterica subsp. enterica serovar Bareilly]|nr:hypothetical protein [Salmonella enterica subsp. enterica serovar Bareilly]
PEALDATIAARADYAGLVFYPASPRAVTSNVAGALTSRAAGQIAMVGLFVDADDAVIADALVAAKLNALHPRRSMRPSRRGRTMPGWCSIQRRPVRLRRMSR